MPGDASGIRGRLKRFVSGGDTERETDEFELGDWTGFEGEVAEAEAIGSIQRAYLAACESAGTMFAKQTRRKLAAVGAEDPSPDEWYPLADTLGVLYAIRDDYGPDSMQTMGRHIPEHVQFPPGLDSVAGALAAVDDAYDQNHRGGDVGSYEFHQQSPGEGRMVCTNPYPCEFDQGLVRGVAQQFADSTVVVEEAGDGCRMDGDGRCAYRVEWVEGR